MSGELPGEFFATELFFNGIRGDTGDYGLPPMPSVRLAHMLAGQAADEERQELGSRLKSARRLGAYSVRQAGLLRAFPVKPGVEPSELKQAGWAVVFPAEMDNKRRNAVKEALDPLLRLRQ